MSVARVPYILLDVFALPGKPFSGNQLAVVHSAGHLRTSQMQAIANGQVYQALHCDIHR